ncbi:UvrD-helicase domain-containing protein [Natronosporangium hydrolyticum]|nr:UvrD-helicase domain-containing protein [Natronosporangium hydrolyticum]
MTIVLAENLHRALSDLDSSARKRVVDFLIKLQVEPHASGVRLKAIKNPRDRRVRTARVTDDLRAVLLHLGDSMYMVQTVLPHDDAYRYAEQVTLTLNPATGAVEALETARISDRVEQVVAAPRQRVTDQPPLLAHVVDRDYQRLGVNEELVPALRTLVDEADLLELVEPLPPLQRDVLLSLVDRSPEQVYADLIAPIEAPTVSDDIPTALASPVNQAAYLVVTDAAELKDALAWPMDRWRTYLHPSQRSLAYPLKPYSGPVRVTGGPGTGKTVVAVHRAVSLARAAEPGERILLTTYGNTLARALGELLERLGGKVVRDLVDVVTTDKLARRVLVDAGRTVPSPLNDADCLAALRGFVARTGSELDPQLLRDEWYRIILDLDLTSKESYLAAHRPRMRRLSLRQREQVWEVLAGFTEWLAEHRQTTFPQVTNEAAAVVSGWETKPYRHVVVDEAQDMTVGQWRLLRAVVPEATDDMFLVGDAHQRIYGRYVVLSHHGIHTRGRSRRLTISYRTTREIARGGLALLKGHHYDDLDGGDDTLDSYRALTRGPVPIVAGYPTLAAELGALAEQVVAWRDVGVTMADIAVGVRTHQIAEQVTAAFADRGIPAAVVTPETYDAQGAVHVMTVYRLKGLEYRCVAIAGMSEGVVPPKSMIAAVGDDPQAQRYLHDEERARVFVAATRPREALWVSWHGQPSPLVLPLVMMFKTPNQECA